MNSEAAGTEWIRKAFEDAAHEIFGDAGEFLETRTVMGGLVEYVRGDVNASWIFFKAGYELSEARPVPQPAIPMERLKEILRDPHLFDGGNIDRAANRILMAVPQPATEPTIEESLRLIRKMEMCEGNAAKLVLLKNFVIRAALALRDVPQGQTDDPVRRDREGWQAGVAAAAERLQDEIGSWEEEAKNNDITATEKQFIEKRIGQIRTHIAQIRELKYAGVPMSSEKEKK